MLAVLFFWCALPEGGGGDEADRQLFPIGRKAEPGCNVALAGAGVANSDDVLAPERR